MTSDARQWLCTESRTQLHSFANDGARCGLSPHWHLRTRSGFAGAQPVPPVVYRDIEPAELRELATAGRPDESSP
jgi:hypothetical protein